MESGLAQKLSMVDLLAKSKQEIPETSSAIIEKANPWNYTAKGKRISYLKLNFKTQSLVVNIRYMSFFIPYCNC